MTNKLSKQYNYAEMSVLNVKSIKVSCPPPPPPPPKAGDMMHFVNSRVARDTV